MNIILPIHHFPPQYSAGAELYTLRLARWLQAHGHTVEVICIAAIDAGSAQVAQATHDEYQGVSVWRLSFDLMRAPERRRWDYDNDLLGAWFRDYLQTHRPDLAHFQAGYLMGVAPLNATLDAGVPTVLTLHDYWYLCPRHTLLRGDGSLCDLIPADPAGCAWCMKLVSRRYRYADQFTRGLAGQIARRWLLADERTIVANRRERLFSALAKTNAVIAQSNFIAQRFTPYIKPERLYRSRHGLDLSLFDQRPHAAKHHSFRVGFIGQIVPHKGVHILIEAFRQLHSPTRPLELHVYGGLTTNPAYVKQLRQQAADDPRIHFHGRFENGLVAEILSNFSVTVVPSIWYEVGPLTIMESQAAGTPVIAVGLGNMPELVRDGIDGLLCKPDATDLARQLQRLLNEPELLSSLRANLKPPRSAEDEFQQVMQIYQSVLKT
jgi:glycosyltransferase involved in cell wall biosynthesis